MNARRILVSSLLLLGLCGCDGGGDADAGLDAGTADSGSADAGSLDAGPPDAGLVAPSGEMALGWVQRVTSSQRLGGVAEARLAPTPGEGVVVSATLGGAPATFGPGTTGALTVGDEADNRATQAAAWRG